MKLRCRMSGHDWTMADVWPSAGTFSWLMSCTRCGVFDEFGTDRAQSDRIWRLLEAR